MTSNISGVSAATSYDTFVRCFVRDRVRVRVGVRVRVRVRIQVFGSWVFLRVRIKYSGWGFGQGLRCKV